MKGRAYVLIFFFWVLLTIITPTLIQWSAAAAASASQSKQDINGQQKSTTGGVDGISARKMMEMIENFHWKIRRQQTSVPPPLLPVDVETESPALAPELPMKMNMEQEAWTKQQYLSASLRKLLQKY